MVEILVALSLALSVLWLWIVCYKLGKASKKFSPRAAVARRYRQVIKKVSNDLSDALSFKFERSLPDVLEPKNGNHAVLPDINITTSPGRISKH